MQHCRASDAQLWCVCTADANQLMQMLDCCLFWFAIPNTKTFYSFIASAILLLRILRLVCASYAVLITFRIITFRVASCSVAFSNVMRIRCSAGMHFRKRAIVSKAQTLVMNWPLYRTICTETQIKLQIIIVKQFISPMYVSDEAHFWLNGYVNKRNCRIWWKIHCLVRFVSRRHHWIDENR